MLDSLRSFAGSPLGIVVFAALIFGLLFFGLGGFTGSTSVAFVGGEEVTDDEFAQAYTAELQQYGGFMTPTRALELGLPQGVLSSLVQRAALRHQANLLKLRLSDEAVAAAIANNPTFQTNGQFDPARVQNVLRIEGLTEAELVELFREGLVRNQLFIAIRGDEPPLPQTYMRILTEFYGEQRTIQYANITPELLDEGAEPTEEEIQAFYDENAADWTIGEVRTVVLLELSSRMLADPDAVTDEEVAARYEELRAANESRDVRIFVFSAREGATAAEVAAEVQARIDAGETFEQLVEAGTINPTNLGFVGVNGINDPTIGGAAFDMAAGETRIVEGRAGATLVHLAEIADGDLAPLEEIADDIRQEIAEGRTLDLLDGYALQIDEGREAGQTLVEVGERVGLPTVTIAVDALGNNAVGEPIEDLPGGNALLTRAFEADVGTAASPVNLSAPGAALWYEVIEVAEPRQLTLEEVRARVIDAWRAETDQLRVELLAESVAGLLGDNVPPEQIEAEFGVTFLTSEPFGRTSTPPDMTTPSTIQAAFTNQIGDVATAPNAAGNGQIVLRVVDIARAEFTPDAELPPAVATVAENIANQAANGYMADLLTQTEPTENWDRVLQIIGAAQ